MFPRNTIGKYEQLLTGAHRKPAPKVSPPFLICHLAFWKPLHVGTPEDAGEARTERKTQIDEYLHLLWRRIISGRRGFGSPESQNKVDDRIYLFGSFIDGPDLVPYEDGDPAQHVKWAKDAQLVSFAFTWNLTHVELRFELHAEYLTLTAILDLSPHKSDAEIEAILDGNSYIAEVYKQLQRLNENIQIKPAKRSPADYSYIHTCLYDRIWSEIYDSVLAMDGSGGTVDIEKDLGTVFADFRGVVLGTPLPAKGAKDWNAFQQPFWRLPQQEVSSPLTPSAPPAPGWWPGKLGRSAQHYPKWNGDEMQTWRQTIEAFWPFLTVEVEGVDFSKYEFTASRMLGGNALYVTALGAQPFALPVGRRFPLHYFIYSDTLNGWQVGRLVDRIHHLGTMRLAAIMELDKLRDAGFKLRGVEQEIKAARDAFHRTYKSSEGTEDERREIEREAEEQGDEVNDGALELVQERKRLEALAQSVKVVEKGIAEVNKNFDGNIEYRIGRSRYYVYQFRQGLQALRIRRLEGYQPYDVFVERRLGPAFTYIEMLGTQYERISNDRAALFEYYLAQHTQNVEIGTRNRNSRIQRLQMTAELALFSWLLPYYGASVIEHILKGSHTADKAAAVSWWEPLIWPVAFALGIFEALRRYRLANRRAWDRRARNLWMLLRQRKLAVGIAILLMGIAAFLAWRYAPQGSLLK